MVNLVLDKMPKISYNGLIETADYIIEYKWSANRNTADSNLYRKVAAVSTLFRTVNLDLIG